MDFLVSIGDQGIEGILLKLFSSIILSSNLGKNPAEVLVDAYNSVGGYEKASIALGDGISQDNSVAYDVDRIVRNLEKEAIGLGSKEIEKYPALEYLSLG